MDDLLLGMLEALFGSAFLTGADGLLKTAAEYNKTAWEFSLKIMDSAVAPIATSIVAVMMMLELLRVVSRVEGDRKLLIELTMKVLFKTAVIIVVVQNASAIMGGIASIGDSLIKNMYDIFPAVSQAEGLPENIKTAAEDMGTLDKIGLMGVLLLPWVVSWAASLALRVVVLMRFAELYILTAAVPLSLSFLSYEETKQIGIGYLKRYGGVVLHGVAIIMCIALYSAFQVVTVNIEDISTSSELFELITAHPAEVILGPIFFTILMFKSGQIARAILGD